MSSGVLCRIFNKHGNLLAEVEPAFEYVNWRLNNVGRARFALPYSDEKCTQDILKFGNLVLLSFENGLPDWGGVIDPPRKRTDGSVSISAYSGEWLLGLRYTAKGRYFDNQMPGYIFDTLLREENGEWPTGVTPYGYYASGTSRTIEYHYHQLLKRMQDLAKLTGNDFAIIPRYDNGVLSFRAFWYERRGSDLSDSIHLIEAKNARITMDEQGPLVNRVILIGEGQTWGAERLVSIAEDADSRAEYGYREWAEVQSGVKTQATLDANSAQLVADIAAPRNMFSVTALNTAPAAFADYTVGDIVTLQAFLSSPAWAIDETVRVIAREWSPSNECSLEVVSWA